MKRPEKRNESDKEPKQPPSDRGISFPIIKGDGKRKINLTREQIDEAMFG